MDDDTHTSTNIITLKWSEQITKPKRSHHCFVKMTDEPNLILKFT